MPYMHFVVQNAKISLIIHIFEVVVGLNSTRPRSLETIVAV